MNRRTKCDDCETIYNIDDITPLDEVEGLAERLDAGGEVPAGECPDEDCRALCYLIKDEPKTQAAKPHVIVSIRGGVGTVERHANTGADVDIVDFDNLWEMVKLNECGILLKPAEQQFLKQSDPDLWREVEPRLDDSCKASWTLTDHPDTDEHRAGCVSCQMQYDKKLPEDEPETNLAAIEQAAREAHAAKNYDAWATLHNMANALEASAKPLTNKDIAKQLRGAASAIEHGRHQTAHKKLAKAVAGMNLPAVPQASTFETLKHMQAVRFVYSGSEPTNEHRASWAGASLALFADNTGVDVEELDADPETYVCDLLADLMHWCRKNEVAFNTDRAQNHFDEEVTEEKAEKEHYDHDVCPKCGNTTIPAENVADQSLRACPICDHVFFENLSRAPRTKKVTEDEQP